MDITSANLPFYIRYFHAVSETEPNNPFDTAAIGGLRASHGNLCDKIDALQAAGILKQDGASLLVPLEGRLVLPAAPSSPWPLAIIAHGNAQSYFVGTSTTLSANEFLSYQGYEILQNELARHGIASFSVNLNIVNAFDAFNDYYQRIELIFLSLLLLKYLAGETITIPATDPVPIKLFTSGGFVPLADALVAADTPGSDIPLQTLRSLKQSLNEKIDFSNLGVMGHSRGATAVSRIFEYFYTGANAGEASSIFTVNSQLNNTIKKLVGYAGQPVKDQVKCIFALQPDEISCKIQSDSTMFFVVAGSHDEDVGGDKASIYERVEAPKVMMYINGATHQRFNYIWRSPAGNRSHINTMIAGDPAVRVLSNQKHDEISRVVFSSFFRATQKNELSQYAYFSRNVRYPVRVDIQRAWNYAYPFQALPAAWKKFDDDIRGTNILNPTGSGAPSASLPFDRADRHEHNLNTQWFGTNYDEYKDFTDQEFSAFLYLKNRNADTATVTIPINVNLANYTHFGFRFAKWYNVENTGAINPSTRIQGIPRRVDLRNFTLQLFESNTPVGRKIDGERISSLIHRAYPTLKFSVQDGMAYYWDTDIILQTVEVQISEFHVPSSVNLSSVNMLVIELTPEAFKRADEEDIFVFNDLLVTKRDLSLPTTP